MRWRIATGTGYHQLNRDMTALQRLADAFTEQARADGMAQDFTRETIEVYMSMLLQLGLGPASRSYSLSSVAMFFRAPAKTTGNRDFRQLPGSISATTPAGQQPFPAVFPNRHGPSRGPSEP
jgi:hypothetical protein